MTEKKNPKVDWGFYAITPRVVRTKYKQLSHAEKWLYTCLKDLCGDRGACFRTLRSLKEETDISIASLSTMIPHLNEAGLIHAEKKRRSASGKEIWHITIVDIWQANKDYCSEIEQSHNAVVQNLNDASEVVQKINNDVQNLNNNTGDCSENERDCSNFSDRRITPKNNSTEEETVEEDWYVAPAKSETPTIGADAPTPAPDTQSSSHEPVYSLDQGLEQPYTPNFQADQEKIRRASDAPAQGSTRDTTPAVAPSGPVQAVGYEKPAQATSQAAAPQRQSAYQAPPRGRGNKPKGNSSKQIYFSTEGSAFRGWYEGCMGYELDVTAANAAAYNKLGRKQGVSQATVQDVLERIQADKWLREHNIVVTVQDLASDTHKYRWEYWYQLIKQCQRAAKAVSHVPTREEDPYSIAALVEQQNPGYFARMEELQNTWKN